MCLSATPWAGPQTASRCQRSPTLERWARRSTWTVSARWWAPSASARRTNSRTNDSNPEELSSIWETSWSSTTGRSSRRVGSTTPRRSCRCARPGRTVSEQRAELRQIRRARASRTRRLHVTRGSLVTAASHARAVRCPSARYSPLRSTMSTTSDVAASIIRAERVSSASRTCRSAERHRFDGVTIGERRCHLFDDPQSVIRTSVRHIMYDHTFRLVRTKRWRITAVQRTARRRATCEVVPCWREARGGPRRAG